MQDCLSASSSSLDHLLLHDGKVPDGKCFGRKHFVIHRDGGMNPYVYLNIEIGYRTIYCDGSGIYSIFTKTILTDETTLSIARLSCLQQTDDVTCREEHPVLLYLHVLTIRCWIPCIYRCSELSLTCEVYSDYTLIVLACLLHAKFIMPLCQCEAPVSVRPGSYYNGKSRRLRLSGNDDSLPRIYTMRNPTRHDDAILPGLWAARVVVSFATLNQNSSLMTFDANRSSDPPFLLDVVSTAILRAIRTIEVQEWMI
jgi:hypothetical protein